ncbi:putative baseplate assembly protein [Streptosporangium sp. NPDC000509]|uniref:putative baseplate assembly protein n=1 Tax=Streptosporangium sp. NPDC000509 TaxID=3366186 RepID=UPI003695177A
MQAPDIDKRTYADIVDQTQKLAGQLSGWKPPPDGAPDPGKALIGVFGRFAELVIERLNRAPDKNYLAFLNLIGAAPQPPRAARVPLTFRLATGSPVDAVVPAGVLAAAPPLPGEQDDVVFETEQLLVVTRTQLQAAYVSDTEHDKYSDRSAQATGAADQPFAVFAGEQASPHQLYLACDPLLAQPGPKKVVLALTSPDTWQWLKWPISWAYWDGTAWHPVTSSAEVANGAWRVTLPALPAVTPSTVNGITAGWLRAQLDLPLPPRRSGLVPESAAVGAKKPQDLALPLSPFPADTPQRFYLSANEAFAAKGGQVSVRVRLSQPGRGGKDLKLTWSYQENGKWRELGTSSTAAEQTGSIDFDLRDGTRALTQNGEISFHVPMSWPRGLYYNRTGRWLRVEVTSGQYTTPPQIEALTVGYDWPPPRLGGITATVQPGAPAPSVPPEAAFGNATGIDLSKDFHPFGRQPQFNDTFYVACPDALAKPGAVITLDVTLTNPPGGASTQVPPPVRTDGNPKIVWEVSDGSRWHHVAAANHTFTSNGKVSLTLPDPAEPTTVNGRRGYWLRARLVSGGYGRPAGYQQTGNTYTYQPETFAPPVVKTLTITAAAASQQPAPVTAGMSYNDFRYADLTASAGAGSAGAGPLSTPFARTADTEPALYLGFDQPFSQRPVTLFLEVEPPLPEQVGADQLARAAPSSAVQLTWEYAGPAGWRPLDVVDKTQGLSRRDLVTFVGPADLAPRSCFGRTLSWLRLRWQAGAFPLPPRLRRILLNTTWATQVTTVNGEILGSGNGDADQAFTAAQTPVQPGQQVTVREPQRPAPAEERALAKVEGRDAVTVALDAAGHPDEIWVRWHAVPDFYQSGPRDRHYTVDPLSGVIRFGDGSHGLIPPVGPNNIRMTYRTGGGEQGNRDSATIVELKSSLPYIDGVTINGPSRGGASVEPIDRVKARGPRILRHRDRAVTAQDIEDLAVAASAEVATAAVVMPAFNPYSLWLDPRAPVRTPDHELVKAGRMGVIIVPDEPESVRPTPSLVLLGQVEEYLRRRCPLTADLWVAGPEWIALTVKATVVVTSAGEAGLAADRVRAALDRYLHPLTGGVDGQGWALGDRPHGSDLTALLAAVAGVDRVGALSVSYEPETSDPDRKPALGRILARPLTAPGDAPERERELTDWLDRALVYSGPHQITVALA